MTDSVVFDCSSVAALILDEASCTREVTEAVEAILRGKARGFAPELLVYEFSNVLSSAQRRGRIAGSDIEEAVALFCRLPIALDPAPKDLSADIVRIASATGLSACDAAYCELALRLNAALVTVDKKLASCALSSGINLRQSGT